MMKMNLWKNLLEKKEDLVQVLICLNDVAVLHGDGYVAVDEDAVGVDLASCGTELTVVHVGDVDVFAFGLEVRCLEVLDVTSIDDAVVDNHLTYGVEGFLRREGIPPRFGDDAFALQAVEV